MTVPIYIGWDSREVEAAYVLAHSLRKHAIRPLDIRFLRRDTLPFLQGDMRPGSTEFTYSRFAVPYLCGYRGRALFMDCDMLAFGDVCELFELPMGDMALRVRKHDWQPSNSVKMDGQRQEPMPRKLWSSLMLMECSKLTLWTPAAVACWTGSRLHRFEGIPDEAIGYLPDGWNDVETLAPHTKLFHYTEGGPWFEGYRDCLGAAQWFEARAEWQDAAMGNRGDPCR